MTSRTPLRRASGIAANALMASATSFFLSNRLILNTIFSSLHSTISSTSPFAGTSSIATHGCTTLNSTLPSSPGHVSLTTPFVNSELTATAWANPMLHPSSLSNGARYALFHQPSRPRASSRSG